MSKALQKEMKHKKKYTEGGRTYELSLKNLETLPEYAGMEQGKTKLSQS